MEANTGNQQLIDELPETVEREKERKERYVCGLTQLCQHGHKICKVVADH